jgi:hypothetical protein
MQNARRFWASLEMSQNGSEDMDCTSISFSHFSYSGHPTVGWNGSNCWPVLDFGDIHTRISVNSYLIKKVYHKFAVTGLQTVLQDSKNSNGY